MVVLRVSSMSLSVALTMNESWIVRVGMDLFVSSLTTANTRSDSRHWTLLPTSLPLRNICLIALCFVAIVGLLLCCTVTN